MRKSFLASALIFITAFIIIFTLKTNQEQTSKGIVLDKLDKGGCLALNYHRVAENRISTKILERLSQSDELRKYSLYEEEFEDQMKTLAESNAYFATIPELLEFQEGGEFPPNCIWISFDDVDETVYDQAFPILEKYDIPFTLFVIASQVGNENFSNLRMATWDQIQEMVDGGLATVGSHTYDMHYLEGDEPVFHNQAHHAEFGEDLAKSKVTIEANLQGVEVLDFAYPFGDGQEELARIIREKGFRTASILAPYTIDAENDPYWLNRLMVEPGIFENLVLPWVRSNGK